LQGFAAGPADTAPVILVRHADAIGRKTWRRDGHTDDLTRPLSIEGEGEAQALGQILSCYAPGRVISSGAQRCLATVGPYAARTDAMVETAPVLTVGGAAADAGGAAADGGGADRGPPRAAPPGVRRRGPAGAAVG